MRPSEPALFVLVDAGATHARALVCNSRGAVLGCGSGGPANAFAVGGRVAWDNLLLSIRKALSTASVGRKNIDAVIVGSASVDHLGHGCAPIEAKLRLYLMRAAVLGRDNTLLSGDLQAEIARRLENKSTVVLMATGSAANISTRFTRRAQTPRELFTLALRVTRQAASARFHAMPGARIAIRSRTIRLRVSNLQGPPPSKIRKTGRLAAVRAEGMEIRKRLAREPEFASGSIVAPLTFLGIGTTGLAALPFEIYSDTGEFLWRRARIIPLCYANGYWGYVPSAAAGPEDYETISSPIARGTDSKLRRAIVSLGKGGG